jgi:hypothetical protein
MSILQTPIFHTEIKPFIQITFLTDDIQDGYHKTIHSIKKFLDCDNYVFSSGTTVYDNNAYNTITMLMPPAKVNIPDLKDFLKLICKRQNIVCFFQYSTTQRVYDYRENI